MPQERPATYRDVIAAQAKGLKIPSELALAIVDQESGGKSDVTSETGAHGFFQLMPETAQTLGVDPTDPVQNIQGGLKYLRQQLDASGGDVSKALALYHGGPDLTQHGPKTQAYVQSILGRLQAGMPTPPPPHTSAVPTATTTAPPKPSATVTRVEPRTPPPKPTAKIGAAPSYGYQLAREVLPAAGTVLGGATGIALGAPAGPLGAGFGGVAGAGAGAAAGKAATLGIESLGRRFGIGTPPPAPTSEEAISQVGKESQTGMMAQMAGDIALPAAQKVFQPFKNKLEPYAKEAMETFRTKGGKSMVLPGEVTKSRALDLAQGVAESSFLGGEPLRAVRAGRQEVAEQKVLDVLGQLGGRAGAKEAGEAVLTGREAALQGFRAGEKVHWGAFKEAAKDLPVTTPQTDEFVASLLGEKGRVVPNQGLKVAQRIAELAPQTEAETAVVGGRRMAVGDMNATLRAAYQEATGPPVPGEGVLSAVDLHQTVSDLGKLTRQLEKAARTDPNKNADLGIAKQLLTRAQSDLVTSLERTSPEAASAYETARTFSRLGNQQQFNETVRRIAKTAPEKIAATLVKPNQSTAIEAVEQAVGKQNFQPVRQVAMEKLLAPDPETGQIVWSKVLTNLEKLGDDTTQALFPGGHAGEVKRIAKLMTQLDRRPTGGMGNWALRIGQFSALVGVATGHVPSAGAAFVLTAPPVISRVFASKTGLKLLTTGLASEPGSQASIKAAARLGAFLTLQDENEPPAPPTPSDNRAVGGPPPAPPAR